MSDFSRPIRADQITLADVERWEADAAREDAAAEAHAAKAATLRDRARRARELFSLLSDDLEQASPTTSTVAPVQSALGKQAGAAETHGATGERPPRKGSWRERIKTWVDDAQHGLSPTDLRQLIANDPAAAEAFAASDKGYYHALARLQKAKAIFRHGGRYYSPKAYSERAYDHLPPEVAAEPIHSQPYSPMGEAVMDIVTAWPGVTGGEIIRLLRTDLEFNASLTPHTSGAYNVMARLARRGQIKRSGGCCYPGPNMPARNPDSKWLRVGRGGSLTTAEGVTV